MTEADEQVIGHLFNVARQIAAQEGLNEPVIAFIINTNATQTDRISQIHLRRLLAGN